jgi:alpha-ketoglutarate-dependent taurine dioxygenase
VATIEPTGQILGATVRGLDLARPLRDADFATILLALGAHGVLHFPDQKLEASALRDFSQRFGRIQATLSGRHHEPGMPEVGILSNIIENGEPIGITDAGQDWHTDMSYNETIGFLNVLYAVKVPRRDGRVLGATMFANTRAAYEDLAPALKARLRTATATHDFNKFWENMRRRPGSLRAPLTPEQRRKRPPSAHPVFLTHPITEIPVDPPLDGRRRAGVGPHRHAAQRRRRLPAGRAPADEALPGAGGSDLRSAVCALGAASQFHSLAFKSRCLHGPPAPPGGTPRPLLPELVTS